MFRQPVRSNPAEGPEDWILLRCRRISLQISPQLLLLFDQEDLIPLFRQSEGSRHAGEASPHHQPLFSQPSVFLFGSAESASPSPPPSGSGPSPFRLPVSDDASWTKAHCSRILAYSIRVGLNPIPLAISSTGPRISQREQPAMTIRFRPVLRSFS